MHYSIDATHKKLGRLAVDIAHILQGKHHASYERHAPGVDTVLITNASALTVTGGKAEKKVYYRHTGYMGHLREIPFATAFAKSPEEVLRRAVYNMLPKNWIRQDRMNRLKIQR